MRKEFESMGGQTKQEIDMFIKDQEALSCVSCPYVRLYTATVLSRRKRWERISEDPDVYLDLMSKQGPELIEEELKFESLIDNCSGGYYDTWSPDTDRPAKMCNSSDIEYSKIEISAGRILETLDWVLPVGVKKILGINK